jgi:hypothetical protein
MAPGGGLSEFLLLPADCRRPLANQRINAMNEITIQQTDEEILAYEVSDEALETAAGKEKNANFTLGACTALSVCPE